MDDLALRFVAFLTFALADDQNGQRSEVEILDVYAKR
jgi:hypothetical protein